MFSTFLISLPLAHSTSVRPMTSLFFLIHYILWTCYFFYLEFSFLVDHFARVWPTARFKYHLLRKAFPGFSLWIIPLSSHCPLPSFVFCLFNIYFSSFHISLILYYTYNCLLSISTGPLISKMVEGLIFLHCYDTAHRIESCIQKRGERWCHQPQQIEGHRPVLSKRPKRNIFLTFI